MTGKRSPIKRAISSMIGASARIEPVWKLFWQPLRAVCAIAQSVRGDAFRTRRLQEIRQRLEQLVPESRVLAGPFAGMRYPSLAAAGSALAPKLLGTYERELTPWIEEVIEEPYVYVIDIGSAEGFYAVGLAMRMAEVRVKAFDTDPVARALCREMARANSVDERLEIGEFCDGRTLANMDLGERSLIIADCEGFELELFDEASVAQLGSHDLIIEAHDFLNPEISLELKRRFGATHDCREISSVDDIAKAQIYDFHLLADMPIHERLDLVAERRPSIMTWLFFRSRQGPART